MACAAGPSGLARQDVGHLCWPARVVGSGRPVRHVLYSALRWAIRQAGLTGATVDAVIAWHYPASDVRVRGPGLLVVGSRGHRGFAEALLGSVRQHCVQHAPGPVVVIRGPNHA
jgi:hypothetical protein